LDGGADTGDGPAFRQRHGIAVNDTVIVVLPGSRLGEISRLTPIFRETLEMLKKKFPRLHIVVPIVASVADNVIRNIASWPSPIIVVEGDREKFDAFAAADVAMAASGTVALELAMARTPAIIAYKFAPLTWFFVRRLVKIRFVHLVNLILDREEIPEFLQGECRPDVMATAIKGLLADRGRRTKQITAYEAALQQLRPDIGSPAEKAAEVVLGLINDAKQ
ncbi:MAG: lipid-A-disaccharide synthase, partial [Alphaproteobacteria bacterium]|nr:lipid-A-disaccharide synthase [Alphaproteobacteria bacterium]